MSNGRVLSNPTVWLATAFVALEWGASIVGPYGWFIDELYYRACATRLDWGFVDHPPLSIALFAASRTLFGDSLVALRLWPALGIAAAALTSSVLARRLGGSRFAGLLAAACLFASPAACVMGNFFSMNAFEPLLWTACAAVFFDALAGSGRRWLGFGALLGLAVLNKHTSASLGVALLVGSWFTSARRQYLTRWPWFAALLAGLIVLPNVLWQVGNGWPSLEFYERAHAIKNIATPPLAILQSQLLIVGPLAAPIAILGLIALLRDRARPGSRALGIGFLLLLAALILSQSSRADRLLGYYPILFAAGATALERILPSRASWLRATSLALLLASAIAFFPLTLPLFPPELVTAYAAALHVVPQAEKNRSSALPPWLADRVGWPDFVLAVADVYRSLSPEEQSQTRLFARSYGEAGALELWGPELGLPRVLSNHNTYFLWSQRSFEQGSLQLSELERQTIWISVGLSREELDRWFERVDTVGAFRCDDCMDWRQDRAISVARRPRTPFARFWPELEHFE